MDTGFIAEYIPLYVEATKLTIGIGLIGIALSLIVGLVISMIQYFKVPVLRQISAVYIELSRNTPLLVQLFSFISGCQRQASVLVQRAARSSVFVFSEAAIWRRRFEAVWSPLRSGRRKRRWPSA